MGVVKRGLSARKKVTHIKRLRNYSGGKKRWGVWGDVLTVDRSYDHTLQQRAAAKMVGQVAGQGLISATEERDRGELRSNGPRSDQHLIINQPLPYNLSKTSIPSIHYSTRRSKPSPFQDPKTTTITNGTNRFRSPI